MTLYTFTVCFQKRPSESAITYIVFLSQILLCAPSKNDDANNGQDRKRPYARNSYNIRK